jgi:nucleotidyltransferase substrate binding protein (TIGR01987 family)
LQVGEKFNRYNVESQRGKSKIEKLNYDPLDRALKQLEEGLKLASLESKNKLLRDGVIQRFEYSIDLSCKFIQRYLRHIAQVDESNIRSKKDLFREAAKLKLINDSGAWIGHYNARSETSHVYNNETAQAAFARAAMFLPDARALLESLRNAD